jgi:hypothetical protein
MTRVRHAAASSLLRIAITATGIVGCASAAEPTARGPQQTQAAELAASLHDQRSIIFSASIAVTVSDPASSAEAVSGLARSFGGYVEWSQSSNEGTASLRLRVPSASLDQALDQVGSLGRERTREISSTDVTESLADLEAVVANRKALRDRLRTLLARAQKVEEVLKIETELSRIQTEIDREEGRLKCLRSQVAMSLLSVQLQRQRVLGPLGYLIEGSAWLVEKLFVIRR